MNCAKTAEMQFGMLSWVVPGNHALNGVHMPPWEKALLWHRILGVW